MRESDPVRPTASFLRATVCGDGRPGPIEERLGRRLLRVVDPDSAEGARLLRSGEVELIGPGGEHLGRIGLEEACRRLRARLERRLRDPVEEVEADEAREGLERLRARAERLGRA